MLLKLKIGTPCGLSITYMLDYERTCFFHIAYECTKRLRRISVTKALCDASQLANINFPSFDRFVRFEHILTLATKNFQRITSAVSAVFNVEPGRCPHRHIIAGGSAKRPAVAVVSMGKTTIVIG